MGYSTTEPLNILRNYLVSTWSHHRFYTKSKRHLYEALDFAAKGKVRVMTEIFALEYISNAYKKVDNGNVRFKAVIHPT
jgi:alcohol dehydrogenase